MKRIAPTPLALPKKQKALFERRMRQPNPDESSVEQSIVKRPGFTMQNLPDHHYYLGDDTFAVVCEFEDTIRVHVRVYQWDGSGFHPTKNGITMSPGTWEKWSKVYNFYISEKNATIVIKKELMVWTSEDDTKFHLQRIYDDCTNNFKTVRTSVTLTKEQYDKLVQYSIKISDSLKRLILGETFKKHIFQEMKAVDPTNVKEEEEGENVLLTNLLTVLKDNVSLEIGDLMQCFGCLRGYNKQLGHDCVTMSNELRGDKYFDEAVASLDPKRLAQDFVALSKPCLKNITVNFLSSLEVFELLQTVRTLYNSEYEGDF